MGFQSTSQACIWRFTRTPPVEHSGLTPSWVAK